MGRTDLVGVVEAAYVFGNTAEDWMRGVLQAASPSLDAGMGLTVTVFRYVPHEKRIEPVGDVVVAGDAHDELGPLTAAMIANMGPRSIRAEFHAPDRVMTTASQAMERPDGVAFDEWPGFDGARALGIRDHLALVALDCTGYGILLGAPLPRVGGVPAEAPLWSQVAVHILAALRLRLMLETPPSDNALIGDDGQVHLLGESLPDDDIESLRDAARRVVQARSTAREDQERALNLWRGLVAGQWSLIDHFDEQGKRFLIARRNDPDAPPVPGLTQRERQLMAYTALGRSNKFIAYTLGLSEATVSRQTRSMLDKLGLRSREDLIAMVRGMG